MKKYNKIKVILDYPTKRNRLDHFQGEQPLISSHAKGNKGFLHFKLEVLKKAAVSFILLLACLKVTAPETNMINFVADAGIKPFSVLLNAIAMVETMGNNLAYNELENAVGKLQIRQVRLDEYNRRTGSRLKLTDMFDPANSERVFLYFASAAGPYHFERIAKRWNGSGPKTELYWERIKRHL